MWWVCRFFFFSSRRRHTRCSRDWSSDVCSSDLFYAAADVYAGPSLEDSFALPPLEAMACGLPVITSVNNGGSQIITEGVDGFVLSDPRDSIALSMLLRRLYLDRDLCALVGENSARTAQGYTWERNARETWGVLVTAMATKGQPAASREN